MRVSGRGVLASTTLVCHEFLPQFPEKVPYCIALVELEEQQGLYMLSSFPGEAYDSLKIGEPMHVAFMPLDDGFLLPYFVLADRQTSVPRQNGGTSG